MKDTESKLKNDKEQAEGYEAELLSLQLRLRRLAFQLYLEKRSLVIVYEGWDAAGKGGNIRRVTERLDPRGYHVYSIAAPGSEGKYHYLWRFWKRLQPPDEKQILIFDRSWYGRVLVERVEGFAAEKEWLRAYREINEFERQLVDHGILLVKFWLNISKDEQLRRFEARRLTDHKRWKLTDEDWRNREKWESYESALGDMLVKTSTATAPWTVIETDDKRTARISTLRFLVDFFTSRGFGPDLAAESKGKGRAGSIDVPPSSKKKKKGRKRRKKG